MAAGCNVDGIGDTDEGSEAEWTGPAWFWDTSDQCGVSDEETGGLMGSGCGRGLRSVSGFP